MPHEEDTRRTALALRDTLKREIFNAKVGACSHRKRFDCLDEFYNGCESDSAIRLNACRLLKYKDECHQETAASP